MAADQNAVKKSLLESLLATFSVYQEERNFAENQLKLLETSNEYGMFLAEITIDQSAPEPVRQLASVILKQYIESHWMENGEKFTPPVTPPQVKSVIRELLPRGLSDASSKIRSSIAYAISCIARHDWPESWPNFFDLLLEALRSQDANVIHGAMRVLAEIVEEISDLQIPHLAPVVLPELLSVFTQPERYSTRTRARAVHIFTTIANLVALMKEVNKSIPREILYPRLPDVIQAFTQALLLPDGPLSDWGLKMEILRAFETLIKGFPKFMSQFVTTILPPVWQIFTGNVEFFVTSVVNSLDEKEDIIDEDGEILSFENMVFSLFEFITSLVETPRFKKTVEQYLGEILFYTLTYMQVTEEQIQQWTADPNQFVEDEEEETFSYSVRISSQYLLMSLCRTFESIGAVNLMNAVTRLKQNGDESRSSGNSHWWKMYEVCLLSLGYVEPEISKEIERAGADDKVKSFIVDLTTLACSATDCPFLLGQALWCSSRYISILSQEHLHNFINACVVGIHEQQPPVLRIFGVKSLYNFIGHLKDNENMDILNIHSKAIAVGLVSIASQYTDSVLGITLETMSSLISVNSPLTASIVTDGNIIPLANALFLKYGTDHHISSILEELFGNIASNEGCQTLLTEKTVPMLVSIIEAPMDKVPQALVPPTLDVLTSVIRGSKSHASEILIKRGFPAVVQSVLRSDDNAVIQNGGECIRAYVSEAMEHILAWHDGNGRNGLSYVVQVICHLLDPRASEESATFVGKLINSLVVKAGASLGDNLDALLRAVLSKLQQAKTPTVVQSLLMVYIQMIRHQLESTLEFLSAVPGPTGSAALDFVLREWCQRQGSFFGRYERRVSCDALCKLLRHALNTGDKRFAEIVVVDETTQQTGVIQTRSKAKAAAKEISYIPVGVKFFKLILSELADEIEKAEADKDNEDADEDDDSDDGEWEDVDDDNQPKSVKDQILQSIIGSLFAPSSDFPGFDFMLDDDEEEEDDPDFKADPINDTNMLAYLTQFVQEFSQQPFFPNFLASLNPSERQCLNKIGINAQVG